MPSPDANSDWAGYHCDVCAHGADLGVPGAREAWEYLIGLRRRLGGVTYGHYQRQPSRDATGAADGVRA